MNSETLYIKDLKQDEYLAFYLYFYWEDSPCNVAIR
jgi:hypothetical protein